MTGDDEVEKLEKEILKKWGILELPVLSLLLQDEKRALKEFHAALQFRKAGNDSEAAEKLRVR